MEIERLPTGQFTHPCLNHPKSHSSHTRVTHSADPNVRGQVRVITVIPPRSMDTDLSSPLI